MNVVDTYILTHPMLAWPVLLAAFVILARSADVFVDSSVALARRFDVPKVVIGIVLVSFATTAPELAVSLVAALSGNPEMALGNAVGSVICNAGLALALSGLLAAAATPVMPRVLRTSGPFLLGMGLLCFAFVAVDNTLGRWEGLVLILLFGGYLGVLLRQHRRGVLKDDLEIDKEAVEGLLHMSAPRMLLLFAVGLVGILVASKFIVSSATSLARWMHIPESVIALTLVALGTSIPEIATCIMATRKGHGAVAVGNILGANTMNICWVAGASAVANDLTLGRREIYFMFPAMLVMVLAMLAMLWHGFRLTKLKAVALLVLYILYLIAMALLFPPGVAPAA